MKHFTLLKTWLAMCLLFVGVGASRAESRTYTIDFNKGTVSGTDIKTSSFPAITTMCTSGASNIANFTHTNCYYNASGCGIRISKLGDAGTFTVELSDAIKTETVQKVIVYASKVSGNNNAALTVTPSGIVTTPTTFDNATLADYSGNRNSDYKLDEISINGTLNSLQFSSAPSGYVMLHQIDIVCSDVDIPTHIAHFSISGNIDSNDDQIAKEGAAIFFPEISNPAEKVFVGWSKNAITGTTDEAPTDFCQSATMGNEDITYYAVFATENSGDAMLEKLSGESVLNEGDNIAVFAKYDNNYYGMYQETVSSTYVNFYILDHTPTLVDVTTDTKNYWTLSAGSTAGTWNLGDDTNGYLYNSSSTNLSVDQSNKSNLTISWDDSENKFIIKNEGAYISCRNDLKETNRYKYRGDGTSGKPTGSYLFDIYRLSEATSYSAYTSSADIDQATLSIKEGKYGTFVAPFEITLPAGVNAYTVVSIDENGATLSNASTGRLDANTPVLVSGTAGTYNFYGPAATEPTVGDSYLIGIIQDNVSVPVNSYVLQDQGAGQKFYKVTAAATGKKNRCYLASTAGAKVLNLVVDGEETAIENIFDEETAEKSIYDLSGRKVNSAQRGIYIVNGKKMLVK